MLASQRSFLPFEIHITTKTDLIHTTSPVKTIAIDLLKPNLEILRTEHMTNHSVKMSLLDIHYYAIGLEYYLFLMKNEIQRGKLETAPFADLFYKSLYIEAHFKPTDEEIKQGIYPLSRNRNNNKMLAIARELDKSKFGDFIKQWEKRTDEIELCLFDSKSEQDNDWLNLYKEIQC